MTADNPIGYGESFVFFQIVRWFGICKWRILHWLNRFFVVLFSVESIVCISSHLICSFPSFKKIVISSYLFFDDIPFFLIEAFLKSPFYCLMTGFVWYSRKIGKILWLMNWWNFFFGENWRLWTLEFLGICW